MKQRFLSIGLPLLALFLGGVESCADETLVVGGSGRALPQGGDASEGGAGSTDDLWIGGATSSSAPLACKAENLACESNAECCGLSCLGARCRADCTSDLEPCAQDAACCGGLCADGSCAPLNTECKTSGNDCTKNTDCCSSYCLEGTCDRNASFCGQPGDVCSEDEQCCTGTCDTAGGRSLGICADAPRGPSNCSGGVAGTVCGACNDCCSRLCAPYGPSGISVCQASSGCRMTGELCKSDSECCGSEAGDGLPGSGNVTCEKEASAEIGICRNPRSCSPQGNSCHFKDYTCSVSAAANKCCDGDDGARGSCELDDLGIPRCTGLGPSCRSEGETCASRSGCCSDAACVPDEDLVLRCGPPGSSCLGQGESCTITADCCSEFFCNTEVGSNHGNCKPKPSGLNCSEYGQACGPGLECCPGIPCTSGRCVEPVK